MTSPTTGTVTLEIEANKLAALYIGHELVISSEKGSVQSAQVQMTKGQSLPIGIDMEGTLSAKLLWSFDGQEKTVVPDLELNLNNLFELQS